MLDSRISYSKTGEVVGNLLVKVHSDLEGVVAPGLEDLLAERKDRCLLVDGCDVINLEGLLVVLRW